jgi:hypothetical protein
MGIENFPMFEKKEQNKVDLSQDFLEHFNNESEPWFIHLSDLKRKYRGQNVVFSIKANWSDFKNKQYEMATSLKAFLQSNKEAECTIVIDETEKECLEHDQNETFLACYNAFASGVKLEISASKVD